MSINANHLFDPEPFGGAPRAERKAKPAEGPAEIKLAPPWVLMRSTRGRPTAHVIDEHAEPNDFGLLPALCGYASLTLTPDGEPLVPFCQTCATRLART